MANTSNPQQNVIPKSRLVRMRVAALVLMLSITAVGIEIAARVAYANKDRVIAAMPGLMNLHEYQERDGSHPYHWRLRPGFVATYEEAAAASKKARRVLGEKFIADTMKARNIPEDQVFVRVNSDGFRGPEIDRTHSRFRILTLGDSCTFGTSEVNNYSRSLERHLQEAGRTTEVINGGVEGYAPRNVLFRIEEYRALRPEMVTIYIGWNALYADLNKPTAQIRSGLYGPRMLRQTFVLMKQFFGDRQKAALEAYNRPKRPDSSDPALQGLDGYVPSFLGDVERVVDALASETTKVVLVTLPGLFVPEETPSAKALEVGHLPQFTDNPYFLARMASLYNESLRGLAQRKGLPLVDLDAWSRTALQPRDKFFFDSVHLYDEGQERIGEYMAAQLQHLIPVNQPKQ